jgi:hypothetical protein
MFSSTPRQRDGIASSKAMRVNYRGGFSKSFGDPNERAHPEVNKTRPPFSATAMLSLTVGNVFCERLGHQ